MANNELPWANGSNIFSKMAARTRNLKILVSGCLFINWDYCSISYLSQHCQTFKGAVYAGFNVFKMEDNLFIHIYHPELEIR